MTEDMPDDRAAQIEEVHEHLQACKELPVAKEASRLIGEADAIAQDLAENDVDEVTIAMRMGQVVDLLSSIQDTENEEAAQHVERATELATTILQNPGDPEQ